MNLTRRHLIQSGVASAAATAIAPHLIASSPAVDADVLFAANNHPNDDGYDLWMRYRPVDEPTLAGHYRDRVRAITVTTSGDISTSLTDEFVRATNGMLGVTLEPSDSVQDGTVLIGTPDSSAQIQSAVGANAYSGLGDEGYVIRSASIDGHPLTIVTANTERGLLYGTFGLIRHMQLRKRLDRLDITDVPRCKLRMVNHWDALDRTCERGYAGLSIFQWDDLTAPNPRYEDYARMLASLGINATAVNNVNASPQFLDSKMLPGHTALAAILRRWGITLYLAANFACPMKLRTHKRRIVKTADPFNPDVQEWWADKVAEIYDAIPDFGGFLMKANSEGKPGPLTYRRTHADGANMLARVLKPHNGIVIWRTFVHEEYKGWSEYAYKVFKPLDGKFDDNVVLQTKNGTIDFMAREAYNPLLGAMPRTNQMLELQITQEYTGHATHVCYLPSQWSDVLRFDTRYREKGPTIGEIADGTAYDQQLNGITGVINIGDDRNWTGSFLAAANTHGFGRLAWDHTRDPRELATEWATLTFGNDPQVVKAVTDILLPSWRAYEKYTSPFGVGYMMRPYASHYEPDPEHTDGMAHVTNDKGSGYDRTLATGTGFTRLHSDYWFNQYESIDSCPEEYLMFMHVVPWTHTLRNGNTVIQQIYDDHLSGYDDVYNMITAWESIQGKIDALRFDAVSAQFDKHLDQSRTWRDVMMSYYVRESKILSTNRQWVQIEIERNPRLLLGGKANSMPVKVMNATSRTQHLIIGLDPTESPWRSTKQHIELASRARTKAQLTVTPPITPSIGPLVFLPPGGDLLTLGLDTQQAMVTPAAEFCDHAINVGAQSKNVISGYRSLLQTDVWNDDASIGWVGTAPVNTHLARGWNKLQNDCASDNEPRTMRLRVPPGRHQTWVLIGGNGWGTQPVRVTLGDKRVAQSGYLSEGKFEWFPFWIDGGSEGMTADLTFSGANGRVWRLAALVMLTPSASISGTMPASH